MSEDFVIRLLLLPFSLLYGIGVSIRNMLYRFKVVRSVHFSIPVIGVGNLSVGGTGKSPHIEYLVRWLDQYLEMATLSRGYGRKTAGGREVQVSDSAEASGDEPLQFKRKFPHVPVFVSENRAFGIPLILQRYPDVQCVLLDDAFQHRSVQPGKQILLTEYARPYTRDWLLPAGRLREWRNGARRADIIIVTKCPPNLSEAQKQAMIAEIEPFRHQKVFFSTFKYGQPYSLIDQNHRLRLTEQHNVLLVSAIAGVQFLVASIKDQVSSIRTMEFKDHHLFEADDLEMLRRDFARMPQGQNVILCTEKDAVKLDRFAPKLLGMGLHVFVLPIEVEFLGEDGARFEAEIKRFLTEFRS